MFGLAELEQAHETVRQAMPSTPSHLWPLLAERLGAEVVVKHENHTPIGAFKVRGGLVYLDRLKRELRRNRGQMSERPLSALDFLLLGHADLEQMTDGRGQDVPVAFEVVVVTREAPQRARDVGGDGGLLGNDERLGQEGSRQKRTEILPYAIVPGLFTSFAPAVASGRPAAA